MKMHLPSRYFLPFVGALTVFLLLVIAVYTVEYAGGQRQDFEKTVRTPGILDTVQVIPLDGSPSFRLDSLQGTPVILVFWAGWSDRSMAFLDRVNVEAASRPETRVIALLVKDQPQDLDALKRRFNAPLLARGTALYGSLKAVGVPTAISMAPDGSVTGISVGDEPHAIPGLFRNE